MEDDGNIASPTKTKRGNMDGIKDGACRPRQQGFQSPSMLLQHEQVPCSPVWRRLSSPHVNPSALVNTAHATPESPLITQQQATLDCPRLLSRPMTELDSVDIIRLTQHFQTFFSPFCSPFYLILQVRFSRPESEQARQRRVQSYEFLQRKQAEESWVHLHYHSLRVGGAKTL